MIVTHRHFSFFLVLALLPCCMGGLYSDASAATPNVDAASEEAPNPIVEEFQFEETPLGSILRMFSEMTDRNVVATPQIQMLPISVYLRDVTPMLALEVICKNYNLWYTEQQNIIRVMKVEEYGRELTLRRDERTEVFNLKFASCYTVAEAIGNVFGNRVHLVSPKEVESYGHVGTDQYPEVGDEAEEVDLEQDDDDDDDDEKDEDYTELGGLKMDKMDLARMAQMLKSGVEFSPEMLLERQIGQARAQMTLFPRNNCIIIRSVDSNLVNDIATLIEKVDTPTRELLLEVKTLRIALDDGMESFFKFDLHPNDSLHTQSMASAALANPATFQFEFVDQTIRAEMQLLESEGRVTELSTPLMFVANNAAGKFFQGTQTPIRTGYTVTEAQFNDTGGQIAPAQVTTEYREEEVGVTLEIAPSINEDRTVTMKIVTEISNLNINGGPPFNYALGGANYVGNTDSITKTEIEDIVVAMDGQTLIIGGLIEETDRDQEDKVPVLGDIPIINFFFKDTRKLRERSEIVFLITPRIVMTPGEAQLVNEQVSDRLSDHPYYTQDKDRLLEYDQDTGILESKVDGYAGRVPFPFNVGDAIRKLVHGNRSGGAVVEIGE